MGKLFRPSLDRRAGDEYVMPPCTKVDPNVFTQYKTRKAAQKICMGCPIRNSCLVSVLHRTTDPGGVYGGLTEDNRDDLRKRIEEKRAECQPIAN